MMFCIIGTYVRPVEEVDAALPGHYEFLDKYIQEGKIILAGRRVPRFGGIIICHATSRDEVEAILREDPFWQKRLMEYQITEFVPVKYGESLEPFIEK